MNRATSAEPEPEEIEPEAVVAPAPAPAPPRPPTATGPLTELQRDLLARLKAPPGSAERMAPTSRVPTRDGDDYSADHTGAGTVRPGGAKVA
jgi:hypothetical protein